MSLFAAASRPACWLSRVLAVLMRHQPRCEAPEAELTGKEAAILRDIGLSPEEFIAARNAGEGARGRRFRQLIGPARRRTSRQPLVKSRLTLG